MCQRLKPFLQCCHLTGVLWPINKIVISDWWKPSGSDFLHGLAIVPANQMYVAFFWPIRVIVYDVTSIHAQTCKQEYASAGKVLSMFNLLNGCTFCTRLWAFSPCPDFLFIQSFALVVVVWKWRVFCMHTHVHCRVHYIHHVEFYFQFGHLITFPA